MEVCMSLYREQNAGETDDEDAGTSQPKRKKKDKKVEEGSLGLSAKQRKKVVSKATISDTDSSDDAGKNAASSANAAR